MAALQDNITDLDALIFKLEVIRREAGKNLPVSVSVLQEPNNNPFGTYYEDRQIAAFIDVVKPADGGEFVELYV